VCIVDFMCALPVPSHTDRARILGYMLTDSNRAIPNNICIHAKFPPTVANIHDNRVLRSQTKNLLRSLYTKPRGGCMCMYAVACVLGIVELGVWNIHAHTPMLGVCSRLYRCAGVCSRLCRCVGVYTWLHVCVGSV